MLARSGRKVPRESSARKPLQPSAALICSLPWLRGEVIRPTSHHQIPKFLYQGTEHVAWGVQKGTLVSGNSNHTLLSNFWDQRAPMRKSEGHGLDAATPPRHLAHALVQPKLLKAMLPNHTLSLSRFLFLCICYYLFVNISAIYLSY